MAEEHHIIRHCPSPFALFDDLELENKWLYVHHLKFISRNVQEIILILSYLYESLKKSKHFIEGKIAKTQP